MSEDFKMELVGEEAGKELIEYISMIPDPRSARGVRYRYADLLLICIYAVLAGYSDAIDMGYYAELNFDYFHELIGLESVPSHDTFSRILRLTDFEQLSLSLGKWLRENFPDICIKNEGMKILHIDGKATRAAAEKSAGEKPIYQLNAMYEGESIGVEIKRVGEKENEISALPGYLKQFNLKNTIVTMDAIGCNKKVIEAIKEKKGNYVVPVKDNQKNLRKAIAQKAAELEASGSFAKLDKAEVLKKEHGRIEKVVMTMIKNTAFIYEELGLDSFFGTIARIGVMDKKVTIYKNGEEETTVSRSYLITDLEGLSVENMLKIKAAHWNIEMQHWLLDIQLGEDQKTARKGNAVTNGGILRRFCLMLRKHDKELSGKPLKRFLMSNSHDIRRIEKLLFNKAASDVENVK